MNIINFLWFFLFLICFISPLSFIPLIGLLGGYIYRKTNKIITIIYGILMTFAGLYGYINYILFLMDNWERADLLEKIL